MATAEDLEVSGKVSPFSRPGLGPWLNGHSSEWDAIVVWRLDRLTRHLGYFLAMMTWCEQNGKTIISVDESLDLSTPMGRMFAQLLVMFGQYEREVDSQRVKQHYAHQQSRGKYAGNQCPFGLRPSASCGFEHDSDYAPVVREMADRLIDGQSLNQIARWLNDSEVPTSRNVVRMRSGKPAKESRWAGHTVHKVLSGRGILGEVTSGGKPVHDEQGHVITRCGPIIDYAQWHKVQAILAAHPSHVRVDASPLLGIAHCAICDAAMYVVKVRTAGKLYRYYHCRNANTGDCSNRRVSADAMEDSLRDDFMARVGHTMYLSSTVSCGRDDAKIAQLAETIGSLSSRLALARAMGQPTDVLEAQVAEVQAELVTAMSASTEPSIEINDTGETMGSVFAKLGDNKRNLWLRSMGVRMTAQRTNDGVDISVDPGRFVHGAS